MRYRWDTYTNWWRIDLYSEFPAFRLGWWWDRWCGCFECVIYLFFWTITITSQEKIKKGKKNVGNTGN